MAKKDGNLTKETLSKCQSLFRKKNYKGAIELCDILIRKKTNLGIAWFLKGMSLHHLKKFRQAISTFQKASVHSPKQWMPHSGKGMSYFALRDIKHSKKSLEKSISLGSDDIDTLVLCAFCYAFDQEKIKIRKYLKKAIGINKTETRKSIKTFFDLALKSKMLSEKQKEEIRKSMKFI